MPPKTSFDDTSTSSGTSRSSLSILRTTSSLIKDMGWTGLGQSAIGTVLLAVLLGGVDLLNAMLNVPIMVLNALGSVLAGLQTGIFGGLINFIAASFGAGAGAFGSGWTGLLGVFQTPLGIGIALLTLWEVMYFMDIVDTDVIGVVIDLPDILFNSDDSGVADEDE